MAMRIVENLNKYVPLLLFKQVYTTIKRSSLFISLFFVQDGVEQLDDYCKMSRERAEIEAKYSKMLSQHAEKWRAHVDRTVSAGSVKTVWNELIGEATALSRVHNSLKDCLIDDVSGDVTIYCDIIKASLQIVNETTTYRKNSLHTSVFKGPKEIREIEDHFEKVAS